MKVLVDGVALPDAEGRAFWQRFSAWMEEHRGDLAGFATAEGFVSVHPAVENGQPVLLVSRTVPQRPYASVAHGQSAAGGSGGRQKTMTGDRRRGRKSKK